MRGPAAQPASVAGCGTLVANPGKAGYYRVRYDAPAHAAIVRDFAKLAPADRLGTLGDDMALGYSGDQDLGRYFETLAAARDDSDPLVGMMMATQVARLSSLYEGTPLGKRVQAKALETLKPVLDRVGLEPRADDTPLVTNLRETSLALLGGSGDPRVVAAARSYVTKMRTDPAAIPAAIRRPILATYAANVTPAEWDGLLAMARAEQQPVVRNGYISLLGAAKNDALARRALELVKSSEFTAPQRASLLSTIAGEHPDMAFDFATANAELVNGLLETSTRSSFIVQLGGRSNDPAMPAKINEWATKNLPEGSRGPAMRTVNAITNRTAIAERLRPAVTNWAGK